MKGSTRSHATADRRRTQVRDRYGSIASRSRLPLVSSAGSCCGGGSSGSSCCGDGSVSAQLGYTAEQLASLPAGADLGLGCGNPTTLLSLRSGQRVLDLGSGAGIDCFLAAKRVGVRGSVIGVDMTPQMITKARENALKGGYRNVEFRLGEIEHLPVADSSVDVLLSNCVINLAPEKRPVYREAFRVLRPGGKLAVSDVVATRRISAKERADPSLWSSCSSGALEVKETRALLKEAGFRDIQIEVPSSGGTPVSLKDPASIGVVPANIRATKPRE
jgi:SAM-dependent methyltransferase